MTTTYDHSGKGSDENVVNLNEHQPEDKKGTRRGWLQNISLRVILFSLLVLLLTNLVILIIILLTRQNSCSEYPQLVETDELQSSSPSDYPLDPNVNVTLPGKLWIVPRREWLAKPPKKKQVPLQLPVPYVIIMHSATDNCSDQASCTSHVRFIQNSQMDQRGWDDIGYSFLVGGDGNVYEGRGWKYVGAQVYGYNKKCIGIVFIGTFNQMMPPEKQTVAAKQLIEIGIQEGYIAKDYKLLAARQLQTTESPGLLLYEDVKKWSHWAEHP